MAYLYYAVSGCNMFNVFIADRINANGAGIVLFLLKKGKYPLIMWLCHIKKKTTTIYSK